MTFSTLTFNMQNGQPWVDDGRCDAPVDLRQTVDFLVGQDADIVFLQEVEQGFDGGMQIQPPPHYGFLKDHLAGYDSVFAYPPANDTEIPFGLGLAIFSKTGLSDFAATLLSADEVEFEFGGTRRTPSQRLLIAATTTIQGRALRLMNTHLQAFFMIGTSSVDHPAQRDRVAAELRLQRGPAILAGDMNSAPGEGVVEQFEAEGFRAVQKSEITWRRMPYVLDHLLYNAPLRLEHHAVIPTTASDHHALRAEFSFA